MIPLGDLFEVWIDGRLLYWHRADDLAAALIIALAEFPYQHAVKVRPAVERKGACARH